MTDQNATENGAHSSMHPSLRRRIKTQSKQNNNAYDDTKKVPMDFTVEVVGKVFYGWSHSLDATHKRFPFKRGEKISRVQAQHLTHKRKKTSSHLTQNVIQTLSIVLRSFD